MSDGKKAAGGVLAGLGAIGAMIAGHLDDCGRLAAGGARYADDVAVLGAHGDDALRVGVGGDDAVGLAGLGDDGLRGGHGSLGLPDDVAHPSFGRASLLVEAEHAARTESVFGDAADVTIELVTEAASWTLDAPPEPDGPAALARPRVLVVAADRPAPSLHSLEELARSLGSELESGDVILVLESADGARRVRGGAHERPENLSAIMTACARHGTRRCLAIVSRAAGVDRAFGVVRRASYGDRRGLMPRLAAARDADPNAADLALYAVEPTGDPDRPWRLLESVASAPR